MTRKGGNETSVFDDFQNRFVFRMHKFLASNRIRARRQVVQREAVGSHPPPIHGDWNEGGSPTIYTPRGPSDFGDKRGLIISSTMNARAQDYYHERYI